ncbi:MAG: exonuclease domain-containing protein [Corynebacterium sp.]|nr:exonuclease domain-containing protein [Corynebacterium sp.]
MFPEFVAIDFESPNGSAYDVCAIGMTRFDAAGNVLDEYYSLIRPLGHLRGLFNHNAIKIHGIHPGDVLDAPYWHSIAGEVISFIGDSPLVAHDARSDRSMFFYACRRARITMPKNPWYCTLRLSRKALPELPRHGLSTVFDSLFPDESFKAHHAAADAWACGKIFATLGENFEKPDLDKACLLGPASRRGARIFGSATTQQKLFGDGDPAELTRLLDLVTKSTAFRDKKVSISPGLRQLDANSLAFMVRMGNGEVTHNINSSTDVLILGADEAIPAKLPDETLCITETEVPDFIEAGTLHRLASD